MGWPSCMEMQWRESWSRRRIVQDRHRESLHTMRGSSEYKVWV